MSNAFRRNLSAEIVNNLTRSNLYVDKLLPDIVSGEVFPAIRRDRIDFYHGGGKLFSYNGNEFSTHIKYASIINDYSGDYINNSQLAKLNLIPNFFEGYKRIKENCVNYAGVESNGVYNAYKNGSYAKYLLNRTEETVVILDIEISFIKEDANNKQNRIDILLYNINTRTLRFIEAKHFTNGEIWSKVGNVPKVSKQIERYKDQIEHKYDEILSAYRNYIEVVNHIFFEVDDLNASQSIPFPEKIDKDITLLLFGFDKDQRDGRLRILIEENPSVTGFNLYRKGNIKTVKLTNFWNNIKGMY